MAAPEINPKKELHEEVKFRRPSICCPRRHRRSALLTLSLSDLRRDPHSAQNQPGGACWGSLAPPHFFLNFP